MYSAVNDGKAAAILQRAISTSPDIFLRMSPPPFKRLPYADAMLQCGGWRSSCTGERTVGVGYVARK